VADISGMAEGCVVVKINKLKTQQEEMLYRDMTRINLVKNKNVDMLADTHSIHSGQKYYLCQLLNVHWVTLLVTVPQHSHLIFPHYLEIFSFKLFLEIVLDK
jgi:hypothetical protein